jgi:colicin import membrane protein
MLIRTIVLAAPLLLGAGQQGESGDSSKAQQEQQPSGAHQHDQTLTGKVSQLSDDSVTIQSPQGERQELEIVPQTRVTIGGEDAQRGQLAEGQEVRASYMEHGGARIAVRIDAGGGGSNASGTAEPKKQDAKKSEKP